VSAIAFSMRVAVAARHGYPGGCKIMRARSGLALQGRRKSEVTDEEPSVHAEVDEARDATRRTRLANERTYLAWWRSASVPATDSGPVRGPNWPYELIGVAFAVMGVGFVTFGYLRHKSVEDALSRGEYSKLSERAAILFAAARVRSCVERCCRR